MTTIDKIRYMDYEQKYNEALERAKRWAEGTLQPERTTPKGVCELIFPELRESEDERIRKAIRCYVEDMPDTYGFAHGIGKADMLAWLKKQKSAEWSKEDERIRKWLVDYFTEIGENWIHREFTCEQIVAYLEKQKGKNSPDSTGLYYYDGKKFTCCGFPYNFTMNQQEEQKTVAISENNNSDTNGHLTGKILVEYGAHAKVRDGKRHCEMDWKEFQRLAHYFYELGKTEQKPAEWSEEDEDMLNSCISSIEEAKENRYAYKETDGDTSYDHEIEWLKSLRPYKK